MGEIALAALALAVLVLLGRVLVRGGYGFELTDEGYYMLSLAWPWSSAATTSQFGFIYHPLYVLAGGSVFWVRSISVALTFALAWAVAWLVLVSRSRELEVDRFRAGALSFLLAPASLLVTSFELPQTPSYNTLAFQSILLGVLALVAIGRGARRPAIWYAVLGLAGALCFSAKPTTAAAFALLSLLYLAGVGRLGSKWLALAAAISLSAVAALALAVDGSISGFAHRLRQGIDLGKLLLGGHQGSSIWRWDVISWTVGLQVTCAAVALIVAALARASISNRRACRALLLISMLVAAIVSILLSLDAFTLDASLERYAGVTILAIAVGCVLAAVSMHRKADLGARTWALASVFLAIPHAYAFGSGRPYWMNAQGAGFFWILAGMVVLAKLRPAGLGQRAVLSLGGMTVLAVSFFVFAAMEFPMRQPQPLRLAEGVITLGEGEGKLVVADDMARYVRTLRALASDGGFKPGDPLIDFTGHSPGAVYAVGGTAPGVPWLLGGYPGSAAFAVKGLELAGCRTLARAWLLTEPEGPDRVPTDVLLQLGLDPVADYRAVGQALTPQATYKVGAKQILWAPVGSIESKVARCENKRAGLVR